MIKVTGRQIEPGPGVKNLNPHLFETKQTAITAMPKSKLIRQRTKPLSNQLEIEFGEYLKVMYGATPSSFYEQAITVRLANGLRYTPDWVVCRDISTICFEVKGPHVWDDAIAKVKMAATVYPRWHWFLAWKSGSSWECQAVLV